MTTMPNKTIASTPGLDKQAGLLRLNIILAILWIVTVLSLPGAAGIHVVAGLLLMIGCFIHLVLHRRWISVAILETPKNTTPTLHHQRRLFWGMFLSGSLCGLSGLAMFPLILDFHAFLPLHCCATPVHILSGLTFLSLNIYHLVLHRDWFAGRLARDSAGARR